MLDSPNPKEPADVKLYKRNENTVGKGKIACYEKFLLFPYCSQNTCITDT